MIKFSTDANGKEVITIGGDPIELAAEVLAIIHMVREHLILTNKDAIPTMLFTNGILLGLTDSDSPLYTSEEEEPCTD